MNQTLLEHSRRIDGTPVLVIESLMREFLPRDDLRWSAWSSELMSSYWNSKKPVSPVTKTGRGEPNLTLLWVFDMTVENDAEAS